jgi:hypothetical protein
VLESARSNSPAIRRRRKDTHLIFNPKVLSNSKYGNHHLDCSSVFERISCCVLGSSEMKSFAICKRVSAEIGRISGHDGSGDSSAVEGLGSGQMVERTNDKEFRGSRRFSKFSDSLTVVREERGDQWLCQTDNCGIFLGFGGYSTKPVPL